MVVAPRSLLLTALGCALIALPACRSARRVVSPGPRSSTCLPPLEAPAPVGTRVGEVTTDDFILRVHDVRDILDLMPAIQRVGPQGTRTEPPENALVAGLLDSLDPQERTITDLHATDSGAVIVKATSPIQEKIAATLHEYRIELVRREVGGTFPVPPHPAPDAR